MSHCMWALEIQIQVLRLTWKVQVIGYQSKPMSSMLPWSLLQFPPPASCLEFLS